MDKYMIRAHLISSVPWNYVQKWSIVFTVFFFCDSIKCILSDTVTIKKWELSIKSNRLNKGECDRERYSVKIVFLTLNAVLVLIANYLL